MFALATFVGRHFFLVTPTSVVTLIEREKTFANSTRNRVVLAL